MELSTRRDRAAERLRRDLVEAAIVEFAAHGFGGASTRAIARRAGAHQPQINYHFESKEALWKAAIEQMLGELDLRLADVDGSGGPAAAFAGVLRALVEVSADRPELNRMLLQEATAPSERLEWLVEHHLRDRAAPLLALWDELSARGEAAPVPRDLVYHLVLGASSLLHANAPEARLLFGIEPSDPDIVQAHGDALVALFLPSSAD